MSRFLSLILLSSFIAACAHKPKNPDDFAQIKEISSIAFFSPNMPIEFKAVKARQNKSMSGDIGPWGIPHLLTSEMEAQVKAMGKNYLTLNVDPARIKEGMDIARDLKDFYLGNRYQVLSTYLQEQAHAQGIQHLIVLHPITLPELPDYKGGFGLVCNNSKDPKAQLMGYALFRADIWSVEDQRLVKRIAVTPSEAFFNTGKSCAEAKALSLEKLTSSYQQEFISLAKKSITLTLEKLK